ncbi:MAG: hypothetical protein AVDCRST_MAG80-2058, partial [uncultured Rubrobacteraceae bacterium]
EPRACPRGQEGQGARRPAPPGAAGDGGLGAAVLRGAGVPGAGGGAKGRPSAGLLAPRAGGDRGRDAV